MSDAAVESVTALGRPASRAASTASSREAGWVSTVAVSSGSSSPPPARRVKPTMPARTITTGMRTLAQPGTPPPSSSWVGDPAGPV
jgi:hypothetical protein